jgi:hypothetical protein
MGAASAARRVMDGGRMQGSWQRDDQVNAGAG